MSERQYKDSDWLAGKYHGEGMTTREIADELDCSNGTISRWLKKHDIESRANWTVGVEAAAEANRKEYIPLRTFDAESVDAYEYWTTKVREGGERVTKAVYVHRLLAVAEHGFDAVAGKDVHHKIPIPWLNTPDNIEVVDKSAHGEYHTNQRWGNIEQTAGAVISND